MKMRASLLLVLLLGLAVTTGPAAATTDAAALAAGTGGVPRDDNWWAAVQHNIRASEYHVTWQDHTYLSDLPAAYQAPNRAHNLRTYFTPSGIRVIPRTCASAGCATPAWEWGLTLTNWGCAENLRPVHAAELAPNASRIDFHRPGEPAEWYLNDEQGLEHGIVIPASPSSARTTCAPLVLDLALRGDLTPVPTEDGAAVELTAPQGTTVVRYGDLRAADATGRALPVHFERSPSRVASSAARTAPHTVRIVVDSSGATYPIALAAQITGLSPHPDWDIAGGQQDANFGWSVSTAGDVNGDGFSDVIVGAPDFDGGLTDEGRAFVYRGAPAGLSTSADWTADSNQTEANFGHAVAFAGDINGDGYADVVVGAPVYQLGPEADEGAIFIYHGSATGLSGSWNAARFIDQADAQFGWSVSTAGDVNGDGLSDVIAGAPYYEDATLWDEGGAFIYTGSELGLSTTVFWSDTGGQLDANFGYSVGTAGDVDADGLADVIVGAPYHNGFYGIDGGRACLYFGSGTSMSTTPDWSKVGSQPYAYFGGSVSTAGDVNGDGHSDVVIGAHGYDTVTATVVLTDAGRALVYSGTVGGLSASPAWSVEGDQKEALFGSSVGLAGDVNGDGYADVIVGAPDYDGGHTDEGGVFVYHGSATGLGTSAADWMSEIDQPDAHFGSSVGTAGDVNGDGYSDVIAGAPEYTLGYTDEGAAFVFYGAAGSLDATAGWAVEGDQEGDQFGYSVSTAGDVNGDGYGDVVVGAPSYDGGHTGEGRAYVYHGSATGLSSTAVWTTEVDSTSAHYGTSVSTAGDVNGDGYADVVVGADKQTGLGRAYIYLGSNTGLASSADWSLQDGQYGSRFGNSVSTAGDVNGDGYSDIVIGANWYENGQEHEGRAYAYYGSPAGLLTTPAWITESNHIEGEFGHCVGTAGDVNGDGYSDVIVGAPYYDNVFPVDEGWAFVYHGSSIGLSQSPAWVVESDQLRAHFGYSVATAGDVNGDGFADVIVGAKNYTGRAYVYHGSAGGLSALPAWMDQINHPSARLGHAVGTAGDVNGDGYADVVIGAPLYVNGDSYEGKAYVFHGSAAGLSAAPDWDAEGNHQGAQFGWSVSTAGDVNGDGYADVIVGARHYTDPGDEEGWAHLYYGNGGRGLARWPRQIRSNGFTPVAPLGMTDHFNIVMLKTRARTPMGRERVDVEWQLAPLGTPFTATSIISGTGGGWSSTGTSGAVLARYVSGLQACTPYHWRIRTLYRPSIALGQRAGPWLHIPWNGWNEQDFRTPCHHAYVPLVLQDESGG